MPSFGEQEMRGEIGDRMEAVQVYQQPLASTVNVQRQTVYLHVCVREMPR